MIPLPTILLRLSKSEGLFAKLSFDSLGFFLETISWYMPRIVTTSPRRRNGLPDLAQNVRDVLALNMALSYDEVDALWMATGDLLLAHYEGSQNTTEQLTVDDSLGRTAPLFGLGAC